MSHSMALPCLQAVTLQLCCKFLDRGHKWLAKPLTKCNLCLESVDGHSVLIVFDCSARDGEGTLTINRCI